MLSKSEFLQAISDPVLRNTLLAFLFILAGFVIRNLVLKYLFAALGKVAGRTATEADDFLTEKLPGPVGGLVLVTAVYLAAGLFVDQIETEALVALLKNGYLFLAVFFVVRVLFVLIDGLSLYMTEWSEKRTAPVDTQLAVIIRKSLKVLAAVMAVLFLIQNMGYSVSGLVASLGLGGLTVALAAKDAVSNFFGSIIIILDSPFKIGDWIKTGGVEGTVEEIGFRSTKIRTFEKSLVTVPNFAIANQSVENFTNRDRRRIKFNIGVEYRTPVEKIERALAGIRGLIESDPGIRTDFYLVNLNRFGDSAIEIFVYCFTNTTVWKEYMEIRERFHLAILRLLEGEGVGLAFPSQSIYLEKLPEEQETVRKERT